MAKRSRSRQKPLAARALLLALALSGTFAGWGVLAKETMQASQTNDTAISLSQPLTVASPSPLDLQPIPTIIPPPEAVVLTSSSQDLPSLPALQLAPIPAVSRQVAVRPVVRARSSR